MKLPCEIIQDLLPLYEEGLCSPASCAAVEAHLQECPDCRALAENIQKLEEPLLPVQTSAEDQAVAKSFRKVHRRWRASLIAMFLVVPMLLLTINQVRSEGICFTNIDDILLVWKYVQALERGDFEKAADYMNYEALHEHIKNVPMMDPDTDGIGYQTILLDDTEWVVTHDFFDEYLKWEMDIRNFWGNVIYNRVARTMIPEDVWKEITALEPDLVRETADGELILNGTLYVRLETPWGTYMAEQNSGLQNCTTALDFCGVLELIPSAIYKEAYPELEEQAWAYYYAKKETLDSAKAISLEEFTDIVRTKYLNELENFKEMGYSIENTGYKASRFTSENGFWQIYFGVLVTNNEGRYPVTVCIGVLDGKILGSSSMSHNTDLDPSVDLFDVFALRYSEY